MEQLPQIETERLRLNSFTPGDASQVYAYASDPGVARYTSWHPHKAVTDSSAWLAHIISRQSLSLGSLDCPWAIRKKDGNVIGCIAFKQTSATVGRIDYVLARSEWGRGLMTEAVSGVLVWVFRNLEGIEEVESGGLTENVASGKVLRKCGMTLRKRESHRLAKFGGTEKEVSFFSITREEWAMR